MSSLALRQLRPIVAWDQPASHGGLKSLAPVFLLDWDIYTQNKRGIEVLYAFKDSINEWDEEDFDTAIDALTHVVSTLEGYLKIRGSEGWLRRRIRSQAQIIRRAIECLKRGYAPGTMPSDEERIDLANRRLREIGIR